jgi:hypothetical protein
VSSRRFLLAMWLGIISSISVNQPAFGQERPLVSREVCKIFPSTHLKECGGRTRDSNIGAQWSAENPELGSGAFNSTVLSNLEGLQFAQDQFATRWQEADASIEDTPVLEMGCREVRLVIARSEPLVEAHGTGICHGFAVNFYVSGTLFSDQITTRFKNAMAALDIDRTNHP